MSQPLYSPALLRTWLRSGLSCLLLDSKERAAELRAGTDRRSEEQGGQRNGQKAEHEIFRRAAQTAGTTRRGPAPPHRAGVQARESVSSLSSRDTASSTLSPETNSVSRPAHPAIPTDRVLPPEVWPQSWQAVYRRRPLPPRPLVLWTYAGLGDDLVGTADRARQEVMKTLLLSLRHPGGTHVFWPCRLPSDGVQETEKGESPPSLFWSGEALLRPRAILVFGAESRHLLGLPDLAPYGQERRAGRLMVQLPDTSVLTGPHGEAAIRQTLAFLGRLLRFCCVARSQS